MHAAYLQWGTYWWHSHNGDQYMDGLRAPFVIHAANEVHEYDEEYTIILGDVSRRSLLILARLRRWSTRRYAELPLTSAIRSGTTNRQRS